MRDLTSKAEIEYQFMEFFILPSGVQPLRSSEANGAGEITFIFMLTWVPTTTMPEEIEIAFATSTATPWTLF